MLKSIELTGFKSFGKKTELLFTSRVAGIVGPNGSGKSNVAEAFRFVLGEQSMKSLRSKKGEDLIWGGSAALPRGNRASAKVTFDNSKRLLDIDFPEVQIERVVYRDGVNEYSINGSQVRLKDVIRLLAGANIGGSGYQIISQGEADRILNASPKERREMIEDALGLKLYQHKKIESERKLEETNENKERVQSLLREITPHLHFLRKQVEKIEKAREMGGELAHKLSEYLAREHAYIEQQTAHVAQEKEIHAADARDIEARIAAARAALDLAEKSSSGTEGSGILATLAHEEQALVEARRARDEAARALGRAEGELTGAQHALASGTGTKNERIMRVPISEHAGLADEALAKAEEAHDFAVVKSAIRDARAQVQTIMRLSASGEHAPSSAVQEALVRAQEKVAHGAALLEQMQAAERAHEKTIASLRAEHLAARETSHAVETELVSLKSMLHEAQGRIAHVERTLADMARLREAFDNELREGIALVGREVIKWKTEEIPQGALSEDRRMQDERRRGIERLKIKLEEYGAGNSDEVIKEFNVTKERDSFLTRELSDLEQSAASLKNIIAELDQKIDEHFKIGLEKINKAFKAYFAELFSGGDAGLSLETERREPAEDEDDAGGLEDSAAAEPMTPGLAISVQLPRKKVRGLEVLSGGERALTSIALIFAMSQVNPPPFIILDETDAALDEANSRRYADIVKSLSAHSQLILITHNRATMAAAGELYGVTMGHDGISKLLSVKLEEAERVAK